MLKQAVAFIDKGEYTSPIAARQKGGEGSGPAAAKPPPEFAKALKANKKAAAVFAAFSPSCKKEYVEWIADAKRAGDARQANRDGVEWISEGKQRNWKYQNC